MLNNKHINDFLDYYIQLSSPQYAVMLKGKWGSGKTYFIDEYKNTLDKNEQKYIYVSLYGVQNYDEIETKFFEVLHPILSNKKTVLAGKFAKGLLKATLKVDLNDDGKADGSLSGQLPNLEQSDFLNTQNHMLIFDDLERCSIPINDVLGYINYFVEHQNYKVIIIANEEELDKKNEKYKNIKEKLVGKTFELTSNVDIAYDSFIQKLDDEIKLLLNEYKDEIIKIYHQSKYDNLRLLRQTILDFERFYKIVLQEHREKIDILIDILRLYFIFSLESKSGNSDIFNLKKYYDEYFTLLIAQNHNDKEKAKKTKYNKLIQQYNLEIYENSIFEISDWKNIVSNSLIEQYKLNELIKISKYYIDDNSPNWKKLWNFRKLDDESFIKVLHDVEEELKSFKLSSIIEVRHVHAILINLKKYGLYKQKKVVILDYSKKHIDYFYENNLIDRSVYENDEFAISEDFNGSGLGYFDENNNSCKKFIDYLSLILAKGKNNLYKNDADSLIDLVNSDFKKVYKVFSMYEHKAFLQHLNTKLMIEAIIVMDNDILLDFGRIIKDRYKSYRFEQLCIEIDTLKKLKKAMIKEQTKHKGKLKGFSLETFIKFALSRSIEELENYIKKTEAKSEV